MSAADVTRRITLLITAAVLLSVALWYTGVPAVIPDKLPARISDTEFWEMVTDFSEAGGYFRSDNFLSNEAGYQEVIPVLQKGIRPGGAYLGVGPEQNFTYIVGVEPKIAFIVDIRRQNMIEHLLYKALMELSADRSEFLSRLFSRARPSSVGAVSSPQSLVHAYQDSQPSQELFEANLRDVLNHLEQAKGFGLSAEDEASMRYVYSAFFNSGPNLRFTFLGGGGFMTMPTYGELMTEDDGRKRNWNFLASDDQYQQVRLLQQRNLIVPLVGNFAGPKAIRSVAEYLRAHDAVVTVFYTSNVEQYLFQDDADWMRFYANVSTLPLDSSSMFIRYVLNSWSLRRASRTRLSSIEDVLRANDRGRIRGYYDVVDMSW